MRPVEVVPTPSTSSTEMVSSRFDSHSKEEASMLEAVGKGERVGRTEGQDLQ
jgi:hypothetical protein